ncbi:hypothetical protein [Kutzneria buriramensis]|uniref:Uncharacterized protein n=1 Tax=Kutzneria buriramensis TaxID=1045776 RepID=A0A3E0HAE1_9PSEU|nr:hypothetical protein [Kutzneria buriramensis]REH40972.1 hypothetical protein BCF44_11254 [Kutzneria buriramensis]
MTPPGLFPQSWLIATTDQRCALEKQLVEGIADDHPLAAAPVAAVASCATCGVVVYTAGLGRELVWTMVSFGRSADADPGVSVYPTFAALRRAMAAHVH